MRTTNVIILGSVWDMIPKLTNEQIADLFRGIADWRLGNDPQFHDPMIQGLWLGLEPNFNQSIKKYEQRVEKNRQNGIKGGRPKKTEDNPNNPNGFLENPNNPNGFLETHDNPEKHKDKDKDRDKDRDKDMDKDMDRDKDMDSTELDMFSPLAQKLAEQYLK